jgi:uncharacterized protein
MRRMNAPLETVLREYRARLEAIYGPRLARLVLFGSRARGDAEPDSDIDVMIVLEGPLDQWTEIQRTSQLVSEVGMKYDVDIARVFATREDYERAGGPFFANVRSEGVSA